MRTLETGYRCFPPRRPPNDALRDVGKHREEEGRVRGNGSEAGKLNAARRDEKVCAFFVDESATVTRANG